MDSGIVALNAIQERVNAKETLQEGYVHKVLVAFDMMCNVAFFGGLPDETISSHAARAGFDGEGWGKLLNHFLDLIQKDHRARAVAGDLTRAEVVEAVERSSRIVPENS